MKTKKISILFLLLAQCSTVLVAQENASVQDSVTESGAVIAPVMLNILYAGIPNEVKIAVPGVLNQDVVATSNNGTLVNKGKGMWVIKPQVGSDAVITVTAEIDGKSQEMGSTTFKVRALPPPIGYLMVNYKGNKVGYRGGPITKETLVDAGELMAAIDDGILDIPFVVLGFEVQRFDDMGFAIKKASTGAKFTDEQLSMIKEMKRGQTFLIRAISVKGPDGVARMLNTPIEVIIK